MPCKRLRIASRLECLEDRRLLAANLVGFKLSSDGEYLALVADDGETIISEFAPSFPPQFTDVSYGPSASAISVSRFDTGYFTPATPGRANESPIDLGPIVDDVVHEPVSPASGENLTVSARIHQLSAPTALVTMTYRVMYGDEFSTFMVDDGSIGEDVARDGIYTGVITAGQIEAAHLAAGGEATDLPGKMLRYRISTLDVEVRPNDLIPGVTRTEYIFDNVWPNLGLPTSWEPRSGGM